MLQVSQYHTVRSEFSIETETEKWKVLTCDIYARVCFIEIFLKFKVIY